MEEDEHHHHKSHKHKQPSHFNFINQNQNHNHSNDLSIFPPVNHEDLPIPPPPPPPPLPPHAPLTIDSDDHPSPPPNKHNNNNYTHLINWVNFALHFWNSKLLSFLSHSPYIGLFSSFRFVAATASFLGFVWFWFQRRRQTRVCGGGGGGGEESVEHLKAVIKAKDEKILQLLEQIAHMNKVMLAHYKNPVSKTS